MSTSALPVGGDTGFTGAITALRADSRGLLSGLAGGWPIRWSGWSDLSGSLAGLPEGVSASWGRAGTKALRRAAELPVGKGIGCDYDATARNLLSAAEIGNAEAQRATGDLYRQGAGLQRNDVAAYVWHDLAARRLPTAEKREAATGARDRVAAMLSQEELATVKA